MSYRFTMDNIGEFLFKKSIKVQDTNLIKLPEKLGKAHIYETKINDDIFLFNFEMDLKKNISIESNSNDYLYLNIVLQGDSLYLNSDDNINYNMNKNHTHISYVNYEKGLREFNSKGHFQSLGIMISKEFFQKHFLKNIQEKIDLNNKGLIEFANRKINHNTKLLAKQLVNLSNNEIYGKLYKESKILEILYHEFNTLFLEDKKQSAVKFSEYDIKALHKAKEIMETNLINPPSTIELSKMVKLNDFKLKHGFKKFFCLSPYEILIDSRMKKAKYLLESSEYTISEIANIIGYKYPQSFSTTFTKKVGINPKELIKSRKYYY